MKNSLWVIFLIVIFSGSIFSQDVFTESSILKIGKWYKFEIQETNIYKITYDDLKNIGFETPENIRIYGNGGVQLPYLNEGDFPDDLLEVPIYLNMGADNVFGPGDFLLFYAEGVTTWNYDNKENIFTQFINEYSFSNFYYLTTSFGQGKRIGKKASPSGAINTEVTTYNYYDFHESELINLIGTGRIWFGEEFSKDPLEIKFTNKNYQAGAAVKYKMSMAVRSENSTRVHVYLNDKIVDTIYFSSSKIYESESTYADYKTTYFSNNTGGDNIKYVVELNSSSITDEAHFDFLTINTRNNLIKESTPLFFRDVNSVTEGNIARFHVRNSTSKTLVWNILDHNDVYQASTELSGSELLFTAKSDILEQYVAFDLDYNFPKPVFTESKYKIGWIENQNLHGMTPPELLIVTHPLFLDQAEELAQLHREKDALSVEVVTTDQVYNEFASGRAEACAIRNFARMLWERSSSNDKFRYLLLFGDGSFDNRTIKEKNTNYIPTYESIESIGPVNSYTSDDLFAKLEPGEWSVSGSIDIGVGRFPVRSVNEKKEGGGIEYQAQGVVDKITKYYGQEMKKDWRNQIIFLGDDGESSWDLNIFMVDSDELSKIVEEETPTMNLTKIYLDAYEKISTSTGASFPDVEEELVRSFNKGALIFNYMGHGGPNGITQEKVLQLEDFEKLKNKYFPLFITATCQVSRFDNVNQKSDLNAITSAGEVALLNPSGGAIALYTTTRVVYQSSNKTLNKAIYKYIFRKDENNERYRLGDVIRLAKNDGSNNGQNSSKFTLLGDPAITLPFGEYMVLTDSVNGKSVLESADTISALETISLGGYIAYDDSTLISDFNGTVEIRVFDKEYVVSTLGNNDIPVFDYSLQDKLLFVGKASVINGRFKVKFKLPKDISYNYGAGKVTYYAYNDRIDAKGYSFDFLIGGTSLSAEEDNIGPDISLFMNDDAFEEGGITNTAPILLAKLYDENGINTTGNGIGHDITGILDKQFAKNYLLTDFYDGEIDDYKRGEIKYQLSELEEGQHEILVKAWDIYNNSNEEVLTFQVVGEENLSLVKLFNYPNPMQDFTNFQYSHNLPGEHEIVLEIFDLTGKLIFSFSQSNYESGFVSQPVYWNRRSNNGTDVPPGLYPYRLSIKIKEDYNNNYKEDFLNGRLIIIP